MGAKGSDGIPGKIGPRGYKASKGEMGNKGVNGTGIPGITGPRGPKGFKGERGIGTKGQKGDAANMDPRQLANWKQCAWRADTGTDNGKIKVRNRSRRNSLCSNFICFQCHTPLLLFVLGSLFQLYLPIRARRLSSCTHLRCSCKNTSESFFDRLVIRTLRYMR